MNNKSKPQACSVFGIRGAKVLPFLEMAKQNVIYFYFKKHFLIETFAFSDYSCIFAVDMGSIQQSEYCCRNFMVIRN